MFDPLPNERTDAEQAEELLGRLRDLDGVWGAFVLSPEGELLVWDVPRAISEGALVEVGPRVAGLRDALASGARLDPDFVTLRFAHHRLCVTAARFGTICVITTSDTNQAALRMAVNMTARHLGRLFDPPRPQPPRDPPESRESP
jgi:hypothetical protein